MLLASGPINGHLLPKSFGHTMIALHIYGRAVYEAVKVYFQELERLYKPGLELRLILQVCTLLTLSTLAYWCCWIPALAVHAIAFSSRR
jgi:hypothetical protein